MNTKYAAWQQKANKDLAEYCAQQNASGEECRTSAGAEAAAQEEAMKQLKSECGVNSDYSPNAEAASASAVANDPLACNSSAVEAKVLEQLNDQIRGFFTQFGAGGAAEAATIDELTNVQVLHIASNGLHACVASTKRGVERGETGYTVSWHNKSEGLFRVDLATADILRKKYE